MPAWLNIILSLGGSALIASIIGLIVNKISKKSEMKRQHNEELQREHDARVTEQRHETLENTILEEMRDLISPIKEKIDNIDQRLNEDRVATVTTIRAKMKNMRDQYVAQGFADTGDKATWNELYNHYKRMGGNHFKEYVDQWKLEINELPTVKQLKRKKSDQPEDK